MPTRRKRGRKRIPNTEVHRGIRHLIEGNPKVGLRPISDLSTKHWQSRTKRIVALGRSPSNLYALAQRRTVTGRSFFGHGSWEAYVEFLRGSSTYVPMARLRSEGWLTSGEVMTKVMERGGRVSGEVKRRLLKMASEEVGKRAMKRGTTYYFHPTLVETFLVQEKV